MIRHPSASVCPVHRKQKQCWSNGGKKQQRCLFSNGVEYSAFARATDQNFEYWFRIIQTQTRNNQIIYFVLGMKVNCRGRNGWGKKCPISVSEKTNFGLVFPFLLYHNIFSSCELIFISTHNCSKNVYYTVGLMYAETYTKPNIFMFNSRSPPPHFPRDNTTMATVRKKKKKSCKWSVDWRDNW